MWPVQLRRLKFAFVPSGMRIVLRPWIIVVYFSPVFAKAMEAERARRVLLSRNALVRLLTTLFSRT